MKGKLWLNYKRVNSRPWNINFDKLLLTRILFSISVSKFIDNSNLLINIDETSLIKGTKTNYSWTPVGKNGETLNSKFTNSMNIVLAICSNGGWIKILSNDTLNEQRFIIYLQNLKNWLDENNNFGFKKIWILLVNLAVHRTSSIADFWLKCNLILFYIPPYSPTLAPVELAFGILKRKSTLNKEDKSINLYNYEGYIHVVKRMKELNAEVIRNCYSHFYKELKDNISKILLRK